MSTKSISISTSILFSSNVCRICFFEKSELKNVCENYNDECTYKELYEFCTSSQLIESEDVNISTSFCCDCLENLFQFYHFKKRCQQAEELIKNFLEDYKQNLIEIKFENIEDENFQQRNSEEITNVDPLENELAIEENLESNTRNTQEISNIIEESVIESESDEEDAKNRNSSDNLASSRFICEICSRSYKKKHSLKFHIEQKHLKILEKNENSDDNKKRCKKKYQSCDEMELPDHSDHAQDTQEKIIDEKPFTCELCGLKYKTSNSLTKHKRKHSDDKRYSCNFCGEKFLHWASRRNHIYLKHTGERRYFCHICGEKFYQRGKFNIHIRRHSGELPFDCSVCKKKFITNVALKYHTKEKNHHCNFCNKSFGRKNSLATHMKIHTGEKNYVCPVCHKAFIQNHVLRTHMKSHPGFDPPPLGTVVSQKVLKNQEKFQYPENMYFAHYNN